MAHFLGADPSSLSEPVRRLRAFWIHIYVRRANTWRQAMGENLDWLDVCARH